MNFNLSALQKAVNSKFVKPENEAVEFHLADDGWIRVAFGNVAYFFNYKKLQEVLDVNDFDHYYQEDTQDQISELLSKHIMNQIRAAMDRKIYPEIKSAPGDLI